jgi:hypothetical protein
VHLLGVFSVIRDGTQAERTLTGRAGLAAVMARRRIGWIGCGLMLLDVTSPPRGPAMVDPLEILAEQVEDFAAAARATIELRLQQVPDGECCDFWALVAKLYARGLGATSGDAPIPEPETLSPLVALPGSPGID